MSRKSHFAFKPGKPVFRIDWKGTQPILSEFTISACEVGALELVDVRGKCVTISTRPEFRQLSETVDDAVRLAFQQIADDVTRNGGDAKSGILKAARLAELLAR